MIPVKNQPFGGGGGQDLGLRGAMLHRKLARE